MSFIDRESFFVALGLYVHIPYCRDRCHYCDFTTFKMDSSSDFKVYFNFLALEIKNRTDVLADKSLASIYFGGGTPSLAPTDLIGDFLEELGRLGFVWNQRTEVTLEVNPGTVNVGRLRELRNLGVNRLSVGVQSFNDQLLAACGRLHTAQQSMAVLDDIAELYTNFSVDLLYGLPKQNLDDVAHDLAMFRRWQPPHLSAYNLTLKPQHPMQKNRASDEIQLQMMMMIKEELAVAGVARYEISNFARPGCESQHNQRYWNMEPVLGIGVSSHSYWDRAPYGLRFWNSRHLNQYYEQCGRVSDKDIWDGLPSHQVEVLQAHEALTDFCYTGLRQEQGLSLQRLKARFGPYLSELVESRLKQCEAKAWVQALPTQVWQLTEQGVALSNQVFLETTFLSSDLERLA